MLPELETRILEIVGDAQKTQAIIDIIYEAEDNEKFLRSQRQIRGIKAAKERGVQFGRPQMKFPKNFGKIYQKQRDGLLTVTEASRALNISRQQFYRLRRRFEDEQGITEQSITSFDTLD